VNVDDRHFPPVAALRADGDEQVIVLTTNFDDLVGQQLATGKSSAALKRRCSHKPCSRALGRAAGAARATPALR
jgi:hypothetical protein